MKEAVKRIVENHFEKILDVRNWMHAHPELSYKEYNTSDFISTVLNEFNIPHEKGIVETGIVGVIKGNGEGKVVGLRADIDALPIQEENKVSYCSTNEGIMHACGHDVHSASMLGALIVLNELKDQWAGAVKFLFQPGEERLPGGAKLMIEEGVLEKPRPDMMIGQHVYPDIEVGKVGFKKGMYMASCDEIHVEIIGKGGHAALPHKLVDPILIASQIVVNLQQIVSRNAKPDTPTVLSIGKFIANGATNVIPEKVHLEGTFRTFDEGWRAEAHKKIENCIHEIAKAYGGEAKVKIDKGYPFLVNDEESTESMIQAAREYLGEENVVELDLRMTAEDFAYYSQQVPSCFYRLGTNSADFKHGGLHTSTFNVEEESLKIGAGLMAFNALRALGV